MVQHLWLLTTAMKSEKKIEGASVTSDGQIKVYDQYNLKIN
jgi:hypothetical protein